MTRNLPDRPDDDHTGRLVHRELTGVILECFYKSYNVLGYGFLESVYRKALAIEFRARGLHFEEEKALPIFYSEIQVGIYRTDHFVEEKVMVELKSRALLNPEDPRQVLNCLKAGTCDVGLLLHYGPKPNFHRFVHPRFLRR
jgi:GxxExxY protein